MDFVAVMGTQNFQGKIPDLGMHFLGRTDVVQLLNPSSSLVAVAKHIHLKQGLLFLLFSLRFPLLSPCFL